MPTVPPGHHELARGQGHPRHDLSRKEVMNNNTKDVIETVAIFAWLSWFAYLLLRNKDED
jgi:hypothetical protein